MPKRIYPPLPHRPSVSTKRDDWLTKILALPFAIMVRLTKRLERTRPELVFVTLMPTICVVNYCSNFNDIHR
jgi:hypothetical protein